MTEIFKTSYKRQHLSYKILNCAIIASVLKEKIRYIPKLGGFLCNTEQG